MDFDLQQQEFDGKNCPGLLGKPKIFFFNACRGQATNGYAFLK
jgi:hypothetical protein